MGPSVDMTAALGVIWVILGVIFFLAMAAVHILFALGVLVDAGALRVDEGRRTQFVPGAIWALATLLGGVFVATAYWVIHRSSLAKVSAG